MSFEKPTLLKSILLISPESWFAHEVSKHHYAKTLASLGRRVYFLDPPDDSLPSFTLLSVPGYPNLTIVRGPKLATGLRFYPVALRRWIEKKWLANFEKTVNCQIDTIWLFECSRFFNMCFAGSRLKIYHQVDLNQNFHPANAARSADICFCTTDGIRSLLLPHCPRTYKIHHGAAVPTHPLTMSDQQSAYFLSNGPNAFYIGNLDMLYLDADLLARVVQAHPGVRFHFVGGYTVQGQLHTLTSHLPNVIWWGKVPSQLISTILARADVLLVTYQSAHWRDQASPHKFMEYLASGKVIVATYTDEYKDKRHLLEMVDNSEDYLAAFERVIRGLAEYNSLDRQEARKTYAMAHTYEKQLDAIFKLLRHHQLLTA